MDVTVAAIVKVKGVKYQIAVAGGGNAAKLIKEQIAELKKS